MSINYIGHTMKCDRIFRYFRSDKMLAMASIFRDRYSLEMEANLAARQTG